VVLPGTVVSETVSNLDWFSTIAEMAGAKLPAGKIVRGRSTVPLLKGHSVNNWDNDLYAEYSMKNYCRAVMRCYRTREWKLVRDFLNPERNELYDLANDPEEHHNMFDDESEPTASVRRGLNRKILQKMKRIHDPLYNRRRSIIE
jgi:uncharacterized sulfatase